MRTTNINMNLRMRAAESGLLSVGKNAPLSLRPMRTANIHISMRIRAA